jgi:hypothetical protein
LTNAEAPAARLPILTSCAPARAITGHMTQRMVAMFGFKHLKVSKAMLICAPLVLPAQAWAFDLTGAWASSADQCGKVFKKNGNTVAFVQDSDLYGSGFVADANQLRGRTAQCTIKSRKEVGDTVNLLAACATDIMLSSVQFSLKVLDDNKISRLFPGMEGMEITYYRCPP